MKNLHEEAVNTDLENEIIMTEKLINRWSTYILVQGENVFFKRLISKHWKDSTDIMSFISRKNYEGYNEETEKVEETKELRWNVSNY